MTDYPRGVPRWIQFLDLACATLAGVLWFTLPQIGAWPLVLALPPWILRFVRSGRLTRGTPFDVPLALFLLTAALGVWAAYDREAAWAKFWLIVGAVLLFYAFANAREAPASLRVGIVTGLAVGLSLYFLIIEGWTRWQVELGSIARLGENVQRFLAPILGSRLNANEAGGLLAMMLPFVAWATLNPWLRTRSLPDQRKGAMWLRALLAWGVLALVLLGLLMTASRGAWLASGAAGLLVAFCWATGCLKRRPAGRRGLVVGLLLMALVTTVGVATLWLMAQARPAVQLLDPTTLFNRFEFQENSLLLAKDYALIGAGLDGFQMLYSTYVLLIHVGYISHSHNLFLGVAIDQGVPGLLALIWMWVLVTALVWHSRKQSRRQASPSSDSAPTVGLAALSVLILLLHGTVENALYGRGVLFLFLPLAFALPAVPDEKRQLWQRRCLGLLIIGVPLGLALLWPGRSLSMVHSNLGSVYQSRAELSLYSWPEWPLQDEVRRQVDLSKPVAEFERALALNPRNATANRRLGMIALSLGQYEDALAHLEAAYAAEPGAVTTRQLLGEALIVNGRVEEGKALWASVNREQGQLNGRIFWYEHIGDGQRAAWIKQAASGQ